MPGSLIEMSSATGGTGALTLAAVTGRVTFAMVLGSSGSRIVAYEIIEWSDSTFSAITRAEGGYGSIALATGILTRSKVLWTWDQTNGFLYAAPGALTFGTANVRVFVGTMAERQLMVTPLVAVTGTQVGTLGGQPGNQGSGDSTFALVNGQEVYVPYLLEHAGQTDQAGVNVTTGATASLKLGIYELGTDGLPGRRLVDLSAAPLNLATTGDKTVAMSAYLPPGWYYVGLLASGAATLVGTATAYPSPAGTVTGTAILCLTRTGSYATGLPADATSISLTANTTAAPNLFLSP